MCLCSAGLGEDECFFSSTSSSQFFVADSQGLKKVACFGVDANAACPEDVSFDIGDFDFQLGEVDLLLLVFVPIL